MSSVILTLENRKYKVTLDKAENGCDTIASVEDEKLSFRIEEKTSRTKRILSKDELKKRFRWGPEYEYIFNPTGELVLKIVNIEYVHTRRLWSDTATQRVESQVGSFVSGLIKAAVAVKTRRLDLEKQREEQAVFEQKRYEMLEKIRNEEIKVAQLERKAALWKKSQDLRQYIAAVMEKAKQDEEFAVKINAESWLAWALQQADRLDPLTKSPPSVLDQKDKYLGSYYHY
ncbi:MAG: hypothetical protein ACP59X_00775 [Solidesulfovibrio sp. DCME]|uniref:hypothetical protein n=1 Tax=Solidesulfovibrio sp. DCME TaxID=3447380 RepID=UPI003D0F7212